MYQVKNAASGLPLAQQLRVADTHWTRIRGLLGSSGLADGDGLWIKPCQQVHMFGMRYALDVVFLDEANKVVHTEANLQPWKLSPKIADARTVLELPVGTIARAGLIPGASLEFIGEAEPGEAAWFDTAAAFLCNIALALFYGFFASAHLKAISSTGYLTMTLPFVMQEGLLVLLFLTRRRSFGTTGNLGDWLVGIGGTFLPLFMRPTPEPSALSVLGGPIQLVGFLCAIAGLASLGRSVGIVAANRGIQTDGLYRFVRHPVYACYLVTYFGYILCYPTMRNLPLLAGTAILLFLRVQAEERFLTRDPVYREYTERVPWRLVPRVY